MSGTETAGLSAELEALEAYLMSDDAPPDSMLLSDLDGFLTGVAIGPDLIMPSEWLPVIWGGEEPEFADRGQAQSVLGAIMNHYNEILREVEAADYAPILWVAPDGTAIAGDWAEGFRIAMELRLEAWQPLVESEQYTPFLMPILALCGDENAESLLGLDPETQARIARDVPDLLPDAVYEIAAFWRARRSAGSGFTHTARPRKTGRNEPCPCGSGKKFKKCCGRPA